MCSTWLATSLSRLENVPEVLATGESRTRMHTLTVVEKLCDRVSIIRQGKIVESGNLDELRHLTRTSISVETDKPIKGLEKIEGVHDLSGEETRARFQVESDKLHGALSHLAQFGFKSLISKPPTLEELFMHHYGDSPEAADDGVKEGVSR